jgi:putative aldouronate transport system permease protein
MKIVILFPLPVVLAVMITELRHKNFSKLVQGLVFLPHFFSWVVIVGIFNSIFGMYGPINNLSVALGGEPIYFMGEPAWFRWLVVILSGWKEIGYSSIVYISAIMSIDPALYEAAKIDGASKLKQIWNITIPSIMPTIIVMLIIRIGYLMDAGFEQVYAMLNSLTRETGEIIGTYVYRLGFGSASGDYGLSTAVGLFNGIISLILILGANYFSKKKTGSGVW